ncbi:hypothetical protein BpHYR1_023376, partial [Brachionus plicatilis]
MYELSLMNLRNCSQSKEKLQPPEQNRNFIFHLKTLSFQVAESFNRKKKIYCLYFDSDGLSNMNFLPFSVVIDSAKCSFYRS